MNNRDDGALAVSGVGRRVEQNLPRISYTHSPTYAISVEEHQL